MYWYTTYMLLQCKTAVKKTVCSESRLVSFGASSCEFNNWLFLLFLLVLAMNRTKSKEVYSIQRFVHPSLEPIAVGTTFQRSAGSAGILEDDTIISEHSRRSLKSSENARSFPKTSEVYGMAAFTLGNLTLTGSFPIT